MTPEELAAKWATRTGKVAEAFVAATKEVTAEVYKASKDHLRQDIYDKPIDTRGYSLQFQVQRGTSKRWVFSHLVKAGEPILGKRTWKATEAEAKRLNAKGMAADEGRGQPKWRRTGDLQRYETWTMEGEVGVITNTASYALPRHDLGLSPGDPRAFIGSSRSSPPKAGGGMDRKAPWRKDAIADVQPQKLDIYRKHVNAALK